MYIYISYINTDFIYVYKNIDCLTIKMQHITKILCHYSEKINDTLKSLF